MRHWGFWEVGGCEGALENDSHGAPTPITQALSTNAHAKTTGMDPVVLLGDRGSALNGENAKTRLATSFFDLGTALTDLEFRIAFANHIDSAAAFDHLAIGVAVLQGADTADNFHRIDLVGRFVYFLQFTLHSRVLERFFYVSEGGV